MSFAGLCPTQRRCGHPGRGVFLPKKRKKSRGVTTQGAVFVV